MSIEPNGTFESIHWHLFLNTPKEKIARTILSRVEKRLDSEIDMVSMEPYWKINTLYDVQFRSGIEADGAMAAAWQLLTTTQLLTSGYFSTGPVVEKSGKMEMSLLSDSGFSDAGITWLEAAIRNV